MLLLDTQPATHPYVFGDDGSVPNSGLPVVLYKNVINLTGLFGDARVRELAALAAENKWRLDWAEHDAVYRFTHYHSTAHELLIVLDGSADIRLGGQNGREVTVHAGDAVAIPAGVAHRRMRRGPAFAVAGLYPHRQKWDLLRLGSDDYRRAQKNLAKVGLPSADPLYGIDGPLMRHWKK